MEKDKSRSPESIFLNELSHQVRTPLNSIIGFSTALLASERPEKEKEFLEAIKVSGEMILKIIDEKLGQENISKTGTSKSDPRQLSRLHFHEIQQLKILLVEDDILNVKLIEYLFAEYGMHTEVAYNGKDAIEKFLKKDYELILMDIEMPEMNGYETTSYIRETLNSQVPIIAITAHAMAGEREKCLQLGMNDYIPKPIDASQLFEIIYKTISLTEKEHDGYQEPITNFGYLKETMNGKKEAIKEMLDYILHQLPIYLSDLTKAIEKSDHPAIAKLAHKTKSAVGIMGAKSLEPLLTKMETAGKNSAEISTIIKMNIELTNNCRQALEEIKAETAHY